MNSERSKCFKDQAKVNHEMRRRFSKKHKTAEYKIGEIVYLFNSDSKSRKEKKILGKIPAFEGRVIEKKGSEYKIQYETDENKFMVDWFSVTILPIKQNSKIIQDGKDVIINHVC